MTALQKPASGKPAGGEARLWLRWVLANAVGEAIGLGGTALVGVVAVLYLGEDSGPLATILLAVLAVLAGTLIEGTVVGTAQWLVLKEPLPTVRRRTWVMATGAGALLAWSLGMVPSTLFSLGAGSSGQGGPPEPGEKTVYALAFVMGLVLGPVLGLAQWLVLRNFLGRTALWMPANALAWGAGMVVIFFGIDLVLSGGFGPGTIPQLCLTLACAGAIVGAVHGLALVWLLRPARRLKANPESEER